MPGRFWTKHEDAVLRRWYGRKPAAEIAEELGRSVPAVTNRAGLLGLTSRQRRYTEDKRLRDWVAYFALKGWLDQEIADSWNGTRRTYRLCRRVVCDVRRALGLPANANNARHRAKVAEATRRQLERVGLGSLAEVRKEAYRRFARQRGWPEWLRPRHVQILDVLYEQGAAYAAGFGGGDWLEYQQGTAGSAGVQLWEGVVLVGFVGLRDGVPQPVQGGAGAQAWGELVSVCGFDGYSAA